MRSSRFKSFLVYIKHTKKNIPKNIKNIEKSSQPKLAPSLQELYHKFQAQANYKDHHQVICYALNVLF